jgi:hypothetical protein
MWLTPESGNQALGIGALSQLSPRLAGRLQLASKFPEPSAGSTSSRRTDPWFACSEESALGSMRFPCLCCLCVCWLCIGASALRCTSLRDTERPRCCASARMEKGENGKVRCDVRLAPCKWSTTAWQLRSEKPAAASLLLAQLRDPPEFAVDSLASLASTSCRNTQEQCTPFFPGMCFWRRANVSIPHR